jgi:isocitrate/isopropylmalate dehydrogenase
MKALTPWCWRQANPTALCLSGVMMLRYMHHDNIANTIEKSILGVIAEGKVGIIQEDC